MWKTKLVAQYRYQRFFAIRGRNKFFATFIESES